MSWYWWALEGALGLLNGGLLGFGMWWSIRARTDRLKWKAYAALMGIDEAGRGSMQRSLAASDSLRINIGSQRVDIYTSKATDLTVSIW